MNCFFSTHYHDPAMSILPIAATAENVEFAKQFVLAKWRERATERLMAPPQDLSSSCKFTSLFAREVFGGKIRGNWDHQFVVLPGGDILDLNEDALDVQGMSDPYRHDDLFWMNREHRKSLKSCMPRVKTWISEFEKIILEARKDLEAAREPAP